MAIPSLPECLTMRFLFNAFLIHIDDVSPALEPETHRTVEAHSSMFFDVL